MAKPIILRVEQEVYNKNEVETMTVGELCDYLQTYYHDDQPIILSFNRGYMYGGIHKDDFID